MSLCTAPKSRAATTLRLRPPGWLCRKAAVALGSGLAEPSHHPFFKRVSKRAALQIGDYHHRLTTKARHRTGYGSIIPKCAVTVDLALPLGRCITSPQLPLVRSTKTGSCLPPETATQQNRAEQFRPSTQPSHSCAMFASLCFRPP